MGDDKPETIDQLRDILAKQILKHAIDSSNEQYKLDAYKATATSGRVAKAEAASAAPGGGMSGFAARIRAAERGLNGAEPAETDC